MIACLVATHSVPSFEGPINISLDWGRILKFHSDEIKVTTGTPIIMHVIAWVGITLLLSICLFRVPVERRKSGDERKSDVSDGYEKNDTTDRVG